jgi:hypothetical protein
MLYDMENLTFKELIVENDRLMAEAEEEPKKFRKTGPTRQVSPGQLNFLRTLVAEKCGARPEEVDVEQFADFSVADASGVIESLITGNKKSTTSSGPLASEKQINFVKSLVEQKGAEAPDYDSLTKSQASGLIEDLLNQPNAPKEESSTDEIPAGRYAVTGEDGTTDFYRVDRPEQGKWAGWTFVKLQVGGDYQRLGQAHQKSILAKIEEDGPKEAAIRYGRELGHCAMCGRELTNDESIEAGIGPICAAKF